MSLGMCLVARLTYFRSFWLVSALASMYLLINLPIIPVLLFPHTQILLNTRPILRMVSNTRLQSHPFLSYLFWQRKQCLSLETLRRPAEWFPMKQVHAFNIGLMRVLSRIKRRCLSILIKPSAAPSVVLRVYFVWFKAV